MKILSSLLIFFGLVFCSFVQEAEYDYIPCEPDEAKHGNQGEPDEVIFINDLDNKPVVIYWMNARGEKTEYAQLSEDEEFPVNTYTNHYWVIEDLWGCLGIIQAKSEGDIHFSEFPQLDRGEDDGDGGGGNRTPQSHPEETLRCYEFRQLLLSNCLRRIYRSSSISF